MAIPNEAQTISHTDTEIKTANPMEYGNMKLSVEVNSNKRCIHEEILQ